MKPIFIGIAGGTGVGKSTLCFGLLENHPDTVTIIHLDDYFKRNEEFPMLNDLKNADHPDVVRWDDLIKDLQLLKRGKAIEVQTKSERLNPRYKEIGKILVEIAPKPIILVEGYLALWHKDVRQFFISSIYLDMPHPVRYARRVHFKLPEYETKVLIPMHKEYIEPTKQYAKHVLEVSKLSTQKVLVAATKLLEPIFNASD